MIAARALEQFLHELITKTASITTSLQAKTLTPDHIRQHIYADPRLSFLHELTNRMATGPNHTARSLSTSSACSTPTSASRPPFQQQISIPYHDPLPSTTSANPTNLLFINQQLSRSYSNKFFNKVKRNKRNFAVVDEEQEDEDDDDVDDDDDDGDDESFLAARTAT